MTDLAALPHRLDRRSLTCRAVIETPKGGRAKYDFDPEIRAFALKALLPEGMSFPLDFGFVPSTLGEDGDPVDILVLFDEPMAVGAVADVRLLGVLEAEQAEDGERFRNDRLLAVSCESRQFGRLRETRDLGQDYLDQLERFWVNYNALNGKRFQLKALRGPEAAADAILKATRP